MNIGGTPAWRAPLSEAQWYANGVQGGSAEHLLSIEVRSRDNGSLAGSAHRGSAGAEAVSVFEGRWYAESPMGLQAKLVGRMLL